jgi:hypothetical protein
MFFLGMFFVFFIVRAATNIAPITNNPVIFVQTMLFTRSGSALSETGIIME